MSIRHFQWQTTVPDAADSTAAVWWFLNAGWSTRGNHESQIVWIVTWMKKARIWFGKRQVCQPCNWIPYSSLRYGECWKIACDESMIEARHFGIVTCFNSIYLYGVMMCGDQIQEIAYLWQASRHEHYDKLVEHALTCHWFNIKIRCLKMFWT